MKRQKTNLRKRLLCTILSILLFASVLPVSLSQTAVTAQAAVKKLSVTDWSMVVGQQFTLKLSGAPKSKIKWKSSSTRIASVKKGTVYAKSRGIVKITATYAKKNYTCTIRVLGEDLEYNDFYRTNEDHGNYLDFYYSSDNDMYFVLYRGDPGYNRGVQVGDDVEYLFDCYGEDEITEVDDENLFADEFPEADLEPVYAVGYTYEDPETGLTFAKTFYLDEEYQVALIIWWCID